jgi:esterase/lipase
MVLQDGPENRSVGAGGEGGSGGRNRGRRRFGAAGAAIALLALVVGFGPRARFEGRWVEPALPSDIDTWLMAREAEVPDLKPGEAASILWSDPDNHGVTPIAVVYLHGFSADRHEVEPLVSDVARDLSANAYFARLTGHGGGAHAMGEATTADWSADAARAVAVGGRIGERVDLVGTSTGGTLALWAAAQPEARERLAALVLISPNLGLRDPAAPILTWPWGAQIARLVVGPERCFEPATPEQERHWTVCYPTQALLPMMALVARVRAMDLTLLRDPTLLVYSTDDRVVDPMKTERALDRLGGTGPSVYRVQGSGDPEAHVIAGAIMSPGTTDEVRERIVAFLSEHGLAGAR